MSRDRKMGCSQEHKKLQPKGGGQVSSVILGVGLTLCAEVIKQQQKPRAAAFLYLSCFDIYNQLYVSC